MKNMSIKHRLSVVYMEWKWTAVRVADIWKVYEFRIDENRNKYIAEDPEYNEGQQYEDIFFEYDENIRMNFIKLT